MPSFTPPTERQSLGKGALWQRISSEVGISVVKVGGTYTNVPYPALFEIKDLTEGIDYFLGGRTYVVSDDIGTALEGDGYTVAWESGFGIDPYGSGGYGE